MSDKSLKLEKSLRITYNVISRDLVVVDNDFTTFEALGVLEAAKALIVEAWLRE